MPRDWRATTRERELKIRVIYLWTSWQKENSLIAFRRIILWKERWVRKISKGSSFEINKTWIKFDSRPISVRPFRQPSQCCSNWHLSFSIFAAEIDIRLAFVGHQFLSRNSSDLGIKLQRERCDERKPGWIITLSWLNWKPFRNWFKIKFRFQFQRVQLPERTKPQRSGFVHYFARKKLR